MRQHIKSILCIFAIVWIAVGAGATTLMKMSNTEMAVEADSIVVGQCVSGASQWVNGTLMTLVDVEIQETLKGGAAERLTMVIPGGIDADRPVPIAVTVPGAPTVFANENVLLFLSHSSAVADGFHVVGFSQGVFSLVEDASGKGLTAQQRLGGASAVSLEEMKAEIRRALEDK